MVFKLSSDASLYFENMKKKPPNWRKWHAYYLCLMIGFQKSTLSSTKLNNDTIFHKTFPAEFQPHKTKIIASLIKTELVRKNHDISKHGTIDNRAIKEIMLNLLDHTNENRLSSSAIDRMNKYAEYGFTVIRNELPIINDYQTFLISYYQNYIKPKNQ